MARSRNRSWRTPSTPYGGVDSPARCSRVTECPANGSREPCSGCTLGFGPFRKRVATGHKDCFGDRVVSCVVRCVASCVNAETPRETRRGAGRGCRARCGVHAPRRRVRLARRVVLSSGRVSSRSPSSLVSSLVRNGFKKPRGGGPASLLVSSRVSSLTSLVSNRNVSQVVSARFMRACSSAPSTHHWRSRGGTPAASSRNSAPGAEMVGKDSASRAAKSLTTKPDSRR